jgi:TolA-binding protein
MKAYLAIIFTTMILFSGCSKNLSPLSPELDQKLNNANGQIEELKNNQDSIALELGKIRNQSDMNAQEIKDAQQGILNIKGSQNSGVAIFSGDGGLIMFFALIMAAFVFIYHYRDRAVKAEKTSEILAQSIALHNDVDLDNKVFAASINTNLESVVYDIMIKGQKAVGR